MSRRRPIKPLPLDQVEAARRRLRSRDPAVRKAARIMVGDVRDWNGNPGRPSARRLCECDNTVTVTDEFADVRCLWCGHAVNGR